MKEEIKLDQAAAFADLIQDTVLRSQDPAERHAA